MDAKGEPKKSLSIAFLLLFITISTLLTFFCNDSFLLETLYITINDSISRKVMFFFCNAILIILAIDSGVFRSSVSPVSLCNEFLIRKEEYRKLEGEVIIKKHVLAGSMDEDNKKVAAAAEEKYDNEKDAQKIIKGLDLGVVDDQMEHLELEDLNKRFEEFIEKVKKGRRLEAMQHISVP